MQGSRGYEEVRRRIPCDQEKTAGSWVMYQLLQHRYWINNLMNTGKFLKRVNQATHLDLANKRMVVGGLFHYWWHLAAVPGNSEPAQRKSISQVESFVEKSGVAFGTTELKSNTETAQIMSEAVSVIHSSLGTVMELNLSSSLAKPTNLERSKSTRQYICRYILLTLARSQLISSVQNPQLIANLRSEMMEEIEKAKKELRLEMECLRKQIIEEFKEELASCEKRLLLSISEVSFRIFAN